MESAKQARVLSVRVAFELLAFFIPIVCAGIALLILNIAFREDVREMSSFGRWSLLLSLVFLVTAISSYATAHLAYKILAPFSYTIYTSAVFSLIIFLMVLLRCMAADVLFLYSIAISLAVSLGTFVSIGVPMMLAKARRRKMQAGGTAAGL